MPDITGLWTGPLPGTSLDVQVTHYVDGTVTVAAIDHLTDTSWGPAGELEKRSIL